MTTTAVPAETASPLSAGYSACHLQLFAIHRHGVNFRVGGHALDPVETRQRGDDIVWRDRQQICWRPRYGDPASGQHDEDIVVGQQGGAPPCWRSPRHRPRLWHRCGRPNRRRPGRRRPCPGRRRRSTSVPSRWAVSISTSWACCSPSEWSTASSMTHRWSGSSPVSSSKPSWRAPGGTPGWRCRGTCRRPPDPTLRHPHHWRHGTGPRNLTPEATAPHIAVDLPGLATQILPAGLANTAQAGLSRGLTGLTGRGPEDGVDRLRAVVTRWGAGHSRCRLPPVAHHLRAARGRGLRGPGTPPIRRRPSRPPGRCRSAPRR